MKLRFLKNSIRLRLNRREVEGLASGVPLEERVYFPGDSFISYILENSAHSVPEVSFKNGTIRVSVPQHLIREWAVKDMIGIYFELPTNGAELRIAIEKDLECIEAPAEERDPDAFPRRFKSC